MGDKLPGFFHAWFINQDFQLVLIIPDPRGSTRLVASQPYPIQKISSKSLHGQTYTAIEQSLPEAQTKLIQIFTSSDKAFFLQPLLLQLDNPKIHPGVKSLCLDKPKGKGSKNWIGYTSHAANVGNTISKFLFYIISCLLCSGSYFLFLVS